MSLPPFNPTRAAAPKADPGEGDDVPCVKCGAVALDTGLECSECGHDNYEAVTGKPFGGPPDPYGVPGLDQPQQEKTR
jgi:hypothetical protein